MLHAGLDLSRKKLDICLLSEEGEHPDQLVVPPDVDSLKTLARRIDEVHGGPVCAIVESMTGARLVHDTLEQEGWDVEIADAQKVKGLAPLACKTDKTDSLVLATLSRRDLVPAIWLPDPRIREERELARFRMHLVKHKSVLKNRVHSTQRAKSRARAGGTARGRAARRARQAPLPSGVTPHKLRHTFASLLVACGEDPATVMAQLGHTDPQFTLRVYAHVMRRGHEERRRLKALVRGRATPRMRRLAPCSDGAPNGSPLSRRCHSPFHCVD
jgi:hypothetical protein